MDNEEFKKIEKLELKLESTDTFDIIANEPFPDRAGAVIDFKNKIGSIIVGTYLPKDKTMYGKIFIKKIYDNKEKFLKKYIAHKKYFEKAEFSNIEMLFEISEGEGICIARRQPKPKCFSSKTSII